ncbi:Mitochondrial protein import protein mas5 [Choanephora cucurbitarum]|uniref:Mitochondrial protein import protein mas5 n=1 Tax=Choanephora cucurbitarum TaxID=101091 RepID=A0A1C7NKN0_9FUNG|nr:Mitochondrial protein import protein mas5 [Choanephora cucurbitarum]
MSRTTDRNPRRFKRYDTCSHCGGDGVNSKAPNNSRKAPSDTRCKHCLGKGSLKSYVRCKDCDGKKTINRTVAMRVPKGVHSGHALQLKNKGNLMPDGKTRGGLIFRVQEEPHPVFTRRGDHLYMDVRISLKEALLGFKNKVICTHLDGRTMTATQTAGETIKPDSRKVIQGEGMPVYGSHTNARGDLYITFHVDFPDTIQIPRTREARMAIDDLFETEQERHAKKNAIVIDDDDVAEGQSKNDVISIDDNDTPGPSSKKRKISPANEDEEDNDDDKQPQNILQDAPEDEGMDDPEKVEEEDDELDEDIRDQTFNPFADLFNMFF